jgi:actin
MRKCEILFEKFGCPSVFLGVPAVLSMYAYGLMTGLVVDSGDGVTSTLPVYEGYVQAEAISKRNLAGSDVTENLLKLLRHHLSYFSEDSFDLDIVRDMKEQTAQVLLYTGGKKSRPYPTTTYVPYQLPDGQVIQIGEERFKCGEILFNPGKCGESGEGIQCQIVDSILKCHELIQSDLNANILVCGGTTLIEGFAERLRAELAQLKMDTTFELYGADTRQNSAWIGGSLLSQLSTFANMSISKEEFAENGELALDNTFFRCLGTN